MDTSSHSRTRPLGETAGSPERPPRTLTGPALSFDLAQEIAALQREEAWSRNDRNARTLVEEPGLRVVLTILRAGARIREHQADGWVVIQTLEGYVRVESPGETTDLVAGRLLSLQPGVPHDVDAITQSAFLLTIARPVPPSGAEQP